MKEKTFENKIKKFLKDNNCYFIKYWSGGYFTESGIPDLLVCCNGYFLGLEIKAEKGEPSELQKYNIKKIQETGGFGIVLYPKDFEKFKNFINALIFDELNDALIIEDEINKEILEEWMN